MDSSISKIAMKSVLSVISGVAVLACNTPPQNYTFEAASGVYALSSPVSYMSVRNNSGSIDSGEIPVATSVLAPLFSHATATSLSVSSSATEVSITTDTAAGADPLYMLKSDFLPMSGPDSAGNYYAGGVERCDSESCWIPHVSAFHAIIQSELTRVAEVSNGCQAMTEEVTELWFLENGTLTSDIYLRTELRNIGGSRPGILGCEALLAGIRDRVGSATVVSDDDRLFQILVTQRVVTLEDLPYIHFVQMGFLYDGTKVSSSEERSGVAVEPLVGSGPVIADGHLFTIQHSLPTPAERNASIIRALNVSAASLTTGNQPAGI